MRVFRLASYCRMASIEIGSILASRFSIVQYFSDRPASDRQSSKFGLTLLFLLAKELSEGSLVKTIRPLNSHSSCQQPASSDCIALLKTSQRPDEQVGN